MTDRPILIRAAVVAPVDRPIIRQGAVFCASGRIIAVGPAADLRRSLPPHEEVDLGHAVVLPGLINTHTHLELSNLECGDGPDGVFSEWILTIAPRTGRKEADFPDRVRAAVETGVRQCLRFGVTAVGDITADPQLTRPQLKFGPLRVVSYGEALGLAKARPRFEAGLSAAIDGTEGSEHLRVGLSPHAPYTVDLPGFAQSLQIAQERRMPLCTHLAETRDESAFLIEQSGPFREIWENLGSWEGPVQTFAARPVAFARAIGLLDHPETILAHVNYVDDDDLSMLAAGRATVAYCPRTHAYFGHPPHRWREMLARGVNVTVATDSCASSPNLNLVDDLRLLWRRYGHTVDSDVFWKLVTQNAAHALGMSGRLGSITPGKLADLTAFSFTGDVDPLAAVLDDPTTLPIGVWIGGRRVV